MDSLMNLDLAQLIGILTQLGLAGAAWRLATKIDRRQMEHEKTDDHFQTEVKHHLGMA